MLTFEPVVVECDRPQLLVVGDFTSALTVHGI